jgi:glycosyltransferase involved in cell wall biosynthesis
MKTIGYVLANFPTLSETFIGNEMRAMERLGHRVQPLVLNGLLRAVQPDDEDMARRAWHLNNANRRAAQHVLLTSGLGGARALFFALRQKGIPSRCLLWNGAKLAVVARRTGCTHLHAHFAQASAAHAIVAARLLGIGVSFVGHGHDVYQAPFDLPLKLKSVDFAVAVRPDMAKDFKEQSPKARVEVVACGVDSQRFHPRPSEAPDNGRLLYVGSLESSKGLMELLKALALMDPIFRPKLDIIGDGALRKELEAYVKQFFRKDEVRLLGLRDSAWIAANGPNYLAFVAPFAQSAGAGQADAGPVILKEAMAMGLPIITTQIKDIDVIVDDACALLAPPGRVHPLTQALDTLMRMSARQRAAMGTWARWRASQLFSLDKLARLLSHHVEAL